MAFVFAEVTHVGFFARFVELDALSVLHIRLPGSFVGLDAFTGPCLALSVALIVYELAFKHFLPIFVEHRAEAMLTVIFPLAFVPLPIREEPCALAILEASFPLSFIGLTAVGVKAVAEAMSLHIAEHADVFGSIFVVADAFSIKDGCLHVANAMQTHNTVLRVLLF